MHTYYGLCFTHISSRATPCVKSGIYASIHISGFSEVLLLPCRSPIQGPLVRMTSFCYEAVFSNVLALLYPRLCRVVLSYLIICCEEAIHAMHSHALRGGSSYSLILVRRRNSRDGIYLPWGGSSLDSRSPYIALSPAKRISIPYVCEADQYCWCR